MRKQSEIIINRGHSKYKIYVTTISPSEFQIFFNMVSEEQEEKHVIFNFTDYGQVIKSFRIAAGRDSDELIEEDNEFGWDMFDSVMFMAVGPLKDKNYRHILPANIARLYVWRFWDDARDNVSRYRTA